MFWKPPQDRALRSNITQKKFIVFCQWVMQLQARKVLASGISINDAAISILPSPPTNPHQILRKMVKALKEALRNEITWPQDEEWEELLKTYNPLLPPSLKGCITVVDGSEF